MNPCHFLYVIMSKTPSKMHSNSSVNKNYQTFIDSVVGVRSLTLRSPRSTPTTESRKPATDFFCKTDFQPIWHVCTSRATWISSGDVRHSSHLLALKQLHHWRLMLDEIYIDIPTIPRHPNWSKLWILQTLCKQAAQQSFAKAIVAITTRRSCTPKATKMPTIQFCHVHWIIVPTQSNSCKSVRVKLLQFWQPRFLLV